MTTSTGMAVQVRVGCTIRLETARPSEPSLRTTARALGALSSLWDASLDLAAVHEVIERGPTHSPLSKLGLEISGIDVRAAQQRARRTDDINVRQITIGSIDLALVLQSGFTGVGVYALHLTVRALKNPYAIGSWLPRLFKGWVEGMDEVHQVKAAELARMDQKHLSEIGNFGQDVRLDSGGLPIIETFGIGEEPEDIAAAVDGTD